ncbi:MAG: aspartate/glutamate racemase family protein [Candidatus Margulisbacteria bacterium]|nr:aspartate/glutamate racemase family protein [Candidatus Margulisiibacteriota bacterium]
MPIKTLGILGGMGPSATIYFYQKILGLTPAKIDQDHIPTLIFSNTLIPDRTQAIENHTETHGKNALIKSAQTLEKSGADFIAIPCNTAHFWIESLQSAIDIPILNMIKLTADHLEKKGTNSVGILATVGTFKTQLYQKSCSENGLIVTIPTPSQQEKIMTAIKAVKSSSESIQNRHQIQQAMDHLYEKGAEEIVLGCTELPLLIDNRTHTTDPMDILAQYSVNLALGLSSK